MKALLFTLCLLSSALAISQSKEIVDNQLQAYEVKFKNLMATRGLSYKEK